MSDDRTWRSDPIVALARRRRVSLWDIMLVSCPNPFCQAQNHFKDGLSKKCRLCGTNISDRADEQYSLAVALEREIDRKRDELLDEVAGIMADPVDPNDSGEIEPLSSDEDLGPSRGTIALTLMWIALCMGVLGALAALSHHLNGGF